MNRLRWITLKWERVYYLSALLVIGVFFLLGMDRDEVQYNRISIGFRNLIQLDYKLDDAVLRSRAGITQDYDQIAQARLEFQAAVNQLLAQDLPSTIDRVDFAAQLRDGVRSKLTLVEHYKSNHSLIKIALLFLPKAHAKLLAQRDLARLYPLIETLYKKTMVYYISLDKEEEDEIQKILQEFRVAIHALPSLNAYEREEAESFVFHLQTILKYRRQIDYTIGFIASLSIAEIAHSAQSRYNVQMQAQRIRTSYSKVFLALLSLTLLAFLYHNASRLTKTAQALADMNRELDRKVNEKTQTIIQQQASLSSSAKLSALGEMASGIAHEVNNPLTIILGKARSLRKQVVASQVDVDGALKNLDVVEATAMRIAKIVKGLRSLSRNSEGDPFEEVRVGTIIQDVLELCQEKFKHASIRLDVVNEADPLLSGRPSEIAQVLMNLLSNGYDAVAMLSDRWIKVEVEVIERKEAKAGEGERVVIRVTDSGPGISPELATKIMQPFFTTKEVGRGTGLGLSISTAIIQNHGGELRYDAECHNTRFVIELPLHREVLDQRVA